MEEQVPELLRWARQLFSLSQAGLAYSKNEYDLERYRQMQEIAAEMLASQSNETKESALQSFSMQAGYATPKIDVRGAVIREGKILLIQEQADGRWAMPGGWAVIAVIDANHVSPLEFYHAYKIIFQCSIKDGLPTTSNETLAVDFFAMDALPSLSEGRTNRAMLEEVFAHYQDPTRPTAFN
jgi:hypothetical protein